MRETMTADADTLTSSPPDLSIEDRRRGMRRTYVGQALGQILPWLLLQQAFGVLFLRHLGATYLETMLPPALLQLTLGLTIPTSLLVPPSRGKRWLLQCWFLFGLVLAAVLGATFLPLPPRPMVLVILGLLILGAATYNLGTTFWFPLLHDLVPGEERGRYFGKMRTSWTAAVFLATLLVGWFLGEEPELWRFQVVIAVCLVLYFGRNAVLAKLPDIRTGGGRSWCSPATSASWPSSPASQVRPWFSTCGTRASEFGTTSSCSPSARWAR